MSIQISHHRTGRILLRQLFKEDYPETSLRLRAVYAADVFLGNVRVDEFESNHGPLYLYSFSLGSGVTLKNQHESEELKLLVITEGNMDLQQGATEKWKLATGKICVFRPADYEVTIPGGSTVRYLLFPVGMISKWMNWQGFKEGRYDLTAAMQVFLADILQPPEHLDAPEEWLSVRLINLLHQVRAQGSVVNGNDHQLERVLQAAEYIRLNLATDMSNHSIAKAVGINRNVLGRVFKDHFGVGMAKWQNDLRIELARQLLLHSDKSIAAIAAECGYNNTNTFRKNFFDNNSNQTPVTWRKTYKV